MGLLDFNVTSSVPPVRDTRSKVSKLLAERERIGRLNKEAGDKNRRQAPELPPVYPSSEKSSEPEF